MKILVDENIPLMTVAELRSMGHDVRDIRGTRFEGSDDPDLWAMAKAEHRLLITTDKGFSHVLGRNVRSEPPKMQDFHR